MRSFLLLLGLAAGAVAAAPDAGAQSGTPCPPGGAMPTVTTEDLQAGKGGALTATHDIQVDAVDANGLEPSDLQISVPAGVHVKGRTLISDTPGPLPVTFSWTELQPNATECTASMSVTLQLQAPAPLSFGKLPRSLQPKKIKFGGKYHSAGWVLTALIHKNTDLRPLVMRFKGVARAKLPKASMPFKTVMASLRDLEPGIDKQRYLRGPKWQITSRTNFKHTALFLEAGVKTGSSHDHPVGYEFQALQGGKLIIRVRAAGKCNFGGCTWRRFSVDYLGL